MLDNTLTMQAQISNLKLEILNLKIRHSVLTAIFMEFMQKSDPSLTEEDIDYLFENTTNNAMERSPIKEEIAALKEEQIGIKTSLEWLNKIAKHTEGSDFNE